MIFLKHILDALFPRSCIGCDKNGRTICEKCIERAPKARDTENSFLSVFDYRDGVIKKALWMLKYKNRRDVAEDLGRTMADHFAEDLIELAQMKNFVNPVLIPIPLSKKKLRKRGYNQSLLIAKSVAKNLQNFNLEIIENVLIKTKDTPPQAKIKNRRERLENLKDCFAISNKEKIVGRNIILVDDITTTGATLREATKVLKNAHAKKIISITAAH